ncbi:MAG: hypothetical protein NC300_11795 [Bacteroidales bacterium]|nr:hypothetical protein [Clostridium sp.]MCM1204815.1 hypothetical protein [Bacteroidales bacterium]
MKNLTDEQSALIAEYAADLLLKYDSNYVDRIAENEQENETGVEEESTEDVPAAENTEQENTTEQVDGSGAGGETVVGDETDIAKIADVDGVSITYKDYQIISHYPETEGENDFLSLDASAGYELLVLRFTVSNSTDKAVDISLPDKALDYRVVCNGDKAANAMMTILPEDLGNLEITVNPQEEQEAVLVFQVSDTLKGALESIELHVKNQKVDNQIKIL